MKRGIKETGELIEGLFDAVGAVVEAKQDGFGLNDLTTGIGLIGSVYDAAKGADRIDDELRDLDEAEAAELGRIVHQKIMDLKARLG